jgi:hypothetical protein
MTRWGREALTFAAWAVVGLTGILGVLSILTIGIFVVAGAALLAGYLARRIRSPQAGPGLLTGAGVMLLIVAYLNRGGPGTVCTTSAGSVSCTQEMSPWPWMATALCLIAVGVALGVKVQVRRTRAATRPSP